jgi:beta-glucanase (GH16 family)
MKTIYFFKVLFVLIICTTTGYTQTWQQVWADEFNGSISPDWVFETGAGGWGNNELQHYRRENASVENGKLVITARRENYAGAQYTSARMKTQGRKSWKYGKIEARIAMPAFQGIWPAFWMLGDKISTTGWPACGEIDIMEHINTGGNVHATIHWKDHTGNYANYGGSTNTNVTAYHNYAVIWDASTIKWYVDGVKYHEVTIANGVNGTSEFHENYFILLNMAVGGNWPGFSIDNNGFPAKMYVDYVRVFKNNGTTSTFSRTIQAESFSEMAGVQLENTSDGGGGQNVGWIDSGDWMAYQNINFPSTGSYKVEYRVAGNGGKLSLDLNSGSKVLGSLNVPATGGWQNWTTISHTVNVNAGTYKLGVYAVAGGWNLNWIKITKVSGARMGIDEESEESFSLTSTEALSLSSYPNPASDIITIAMPVDMENCKVNITDLAGIGLRETTLSGNTLDISDLKAGIYIIYLEHEGKRTPIRVVKQ